MAILAPMYNVLDGWHIVTPGPNGQTQIVYFDSAKSYYDMMGVTSPVNDNYYDEEDIYDEEEDIYDEENDIYYEEEDIYDEEEDIYDEEEDIYGEMEDEEEIELYNPIPPSLVESMEFIELLGKSKPSPPFSIQCAASISPKMGSTSDSKFISSVTKCCAADQSAEHPCNCFECFQHYY